MSLFQFYGWMLERSRAPAAQMICVLLIATSLHKMIFDFHVLQILGITSCFIAAFSRFFYCCAFICSVTGRREVKKCHSVCLLCATDVRFQPRAERN